MTLRDRLRAATRSEHEALERSLVLERPDLERDGYVACLRGWLAFCRSIAPDFRAGRSLWRFAADCAQRIAWLEDDLRYLAGSSETAVMPDAGLAFRALPELAGASYVIEGSMLGAQVIYRRLDRRWSLGREGGGSFLRGYGPETGRHWQQFVAALNGLALGEGEEARCLLAARSTFRSLEDAFRAQLRCASGTPSDLPRETVVGLAKVV